MMVNATIIVQMINFGIAYAALRYFVFKPSLNVLDANESEQTALQFSIEQMRQEREQKEFALSNLWRYAQQQFATSVPAPIHAMDFLFRGLAKPIESVTLPAIDHLLDRSSKILLERIINDFK